MSARFQAKHEARHPTDFGGNSLCLQWGEYRFSDRPSQKGYRFIWRRASDGSVQARGPARIPSLMDMKILMQMAGRAGWGWHNGEFTEPPIPDVDPNLAPLEQLESEIFGIGVDSETRVDAFMRWADRNPLSEHWWQGFYIAWSNCDDTWHVRDALLERLADAEESKLGWETLAGAEMAAYEALPKTIQVYRGCSMDRVMGLAWTTDRRVALEFARGHRSINVPDPVLAAGKIRKDRIFMVVSDRGESEIVLDPRRLSGLKVDFIDPELELGRIEREASQ